MGVQHELIESLFWVAYKLILGNLKYKRQEDNFDMFCGGLFELSGHDYKSDRLINICDRDQGILEITERFR